MFPFPALGEVTLCSCSVRGWQRATQKGHASIAAAGRGEQGGVFGHFYRNRWQGGGVGGGVCVRMQKRESVSE